jgi:putative ABC transport system permease protein
MESFFRDLRFALRRLKNSPGFALVAVVTLALGIGANSAMFSIVNAVLLRPLPYRDPERLVLLSERWPQFPRLSLSYLNYKDWRDQSSSFEAVGAVRNSVMTMTGIPEAERVPMQNVTANIFDLLGLTPELGRVFTIAEDQPGAPGTALISHSLWRRHFSSSRDVLGKAIVLDNHSYSIIGVMPPGTEILQQAPDVFLSFEPWARTLPDDRSWHPGILPIARLKSGVSLQQARSDIAVIAERLAKQYPVYDTNVSSLVDPMQEQIVANVRPALLVLLAAVGLVLLIACANVANLLLVRATGRRREITVCVALGARRSDIVRQLLAESTLLSFAGAALGLLLAGTAMPFFLRLAGNSLPRSNGVSLDIYVLGLTTVIALLAGIGFGLAPARQAWRVDLRETLGEAGRAGSARFVLRTRAALVVAEIAFATLLLTGAGLLFKSFERLSQVSPGFSSDHLLIADIVRSPVAYRDPSVRLGFFDRLFGQVSALPGVRAAGGVSFVPVTGTGPALHFNIQGRPPRSPQEYTIAGYRVVSAGYLRAMGIPLLSGRWIEDRDAVESPAVAVVNLTFAKTYFPNQSPIGQHVQVGATPEASVPWMEIVGVVADTKQALASESATEMYVPYRQADKVLPVFALSLVVRTAADPSLQTNAVRAIGHELDANQPITNIRTMEQNIAGSVAQPRFRTVLLAIFAGIALTLAVVGISGVMAYSVAQRTRELGVRMALGATRGRVLQLVVGQGLRLTLIGVVIGIAGSLLVSRYLSSMLFNTPPHDPITLVAVALGLVVVSVCACFLPARRATLIDPMVALREE